MSNEVDTRVSVSTAEVSVEKRFEADRFPVPAIAFEIESVAEDPITVRLVDDVPESFSMEGIGFHPDYDSDNWTAYRDHRVEYETTLDPGETITTVYGIRVDDPAEAEAFLGDPIVEVMDGVDDGEERSVDVLGRETTQVVRDALSGGGELDADAAENVEAAADADDADAEAVIEDAEGTAADADAEEEAEAVVDEEPDAGEKGDVDAEEEADADAEEEADADVEEEADADAENEAEGETEAEDAESEGAEEDESPAVKPSSEVAREFDPRTAGREGAANGRAADEEEDDAEASDRASPSAAAGVSVAAALAAELRAGDVDEDDIAVLKEELDLETTTAVPRSVDARIGRLQSQVEDMLAYREALSEFLDENGTADELAEGLREDLTALTERVEGVDESVGSVSDRVEEVDGAVDSVAEDVDDVDASVETLSDRVDRIDDSVESVAERVAELEERLADVDSGLADDVAAIREDVDDVNEELDELQSFRDRLSSAFGTE